MIYAKRYFSCFSSYTILIMDGWNGPSTGRTAANARGSLLPRQHLIYSDVADVSCHRTLSFRLVKNYINIGWKVGNSMGSVRSTNVILLQTLKWLERGATVLKPWDKSKIIYPLMCGVERLISAFFSIKPDFITFRPIYVQKSWYCIFKLSNQILGVPMV